MEIPSSNAHHILQQLLFHVQQQVIRVKTRLSALEMTPPEITGTRMSCGGNQQSLSDPEQRDVKAMSVEFARYVILFCVI